LSARAAPALVALCLVLCGCAGQRVYRDAQELLAQNQGREALAKLEEATRREPTSALYRIEYKRLRERLVSESLVQAEAARAQKAYEIAEAGYRRTLEFDATNAIALAGIKAVERESRWDAWIEQAKGDVDRKDFEGARLKLRAVLLESPGHTGASAALAELDRTAIKPAVDVALAAAYRKPISLEFRDVPLKTVFELIAKTSGLNFVFDRDVRTDQRVSIYLRDGTIETAVKRMLLANQLEQRVLDGNSIMVYPDTPAKQKDYQILSVRSFYLNNADAKNVASTLKTILKARDVVVDERLNLLIVRDTPEAVRLAERIVALQDLPEPEVMLELEVLEVKRSRLLDLGVRWPGQVSFAPLVGATGSQLTLTELRNLTGSNVGVTFDPLSISARKTDSDANLLANPRIRAKSREKARILIGDRVPIVTTTSTSTGFVADSVNYVDVGLKLDVEPTIFPSNEISIKVALEVSSLSGQVQTKSGTLAYQIGTRNASTVLRLRDGENEVLAGLISDEERKSADKIPGFGEIPLAGRLFGGQSADSSKSEIVLSITPRLIRNIQRPDATMLDFESGTESSLRDRGAGAVASADSSASIGAPRGSSPPPPSPIRATAPAEAAPAASLDTASPAAPATSSDVAMQFVGPAQIKTGQEFVVEFAIDPRKPVVSMPLAIGFDPAAVQVISVEEGDFMRQGGAPTKFESRVDAGGQILVTAARENGTGADQPGRLLAVRMRAIGLPRSTALRLLTVAPQGLANASLNAVLPAPLPINIIP
jgi:general secretion pathway protein D